MKALGTIVGRSLYPILALVVVLGAMAWGPFVSLALALGFWHVNKRIA
jgi:hypothetical protein